MKILVGVVIGGVFGFIMAIISLYTVRKEMKKRKKQDKIEETLGFYADERNYNDDGAPYVEKCIEGHDGVEELDLGKKAQEALELMEK